MTKYFLKWIIKKSSCLLLKGSWCRIISVEWHDFNDGGVWGLFNPEGIFIHRAKQTWSKRRKNHQKLSHWDETGAEYLGSWISQISGFSSENLRTFCQVFNNHNHLSWCEKRLHVSVSVQKFQIYDLKTFYFLCPIFTSEKKKTK